MSWNGIGIEHLDIYCPVCNKFIMHLNVSPFIEEKKIEND